MTKQSIPLQVYPSKLADRGAAFEEQWPIERFTRLCAVLADTSGSVEIKLAFKRENDNIIVTCALATQAKLICQRCLTALTASLDVARTYQVVQEELPQMQLAYEPLEVPDQMLDVLALLEDELLLALPIVPMHAQEQCAVDLVVTGRSVQEEPAAISPFQVLAQFKTQH